MTTNHCLQPKIRYIFFVALLFSLQLLYSQRSIASAEITFEFVEKKVEGSIGDFKSVTVIETGNLSASRFEGSVAVNSIKTGNFLRDWALKGRKYFDEDNHPRIRFSSTSVSAAGSQIKVEGMLTIKGVSKQISIDFVEAEDVLTGTTTLFSSDFGIHIKKKREENKVLVTFRFELD